MTSARSWIASALAAAALGLAAPSAGLAQEPDPKPAKDEGLEKLLEKLEAKDKAEAGKDQDKAKEKPEAGKDKDQKKDSDKEKGKDKDKKPGEVAPENQELDKLLEGLGQTRDMPSPDDKKPGTPGGEGPPPPKGDQPKPEELKGGEKNLDDELERITGKKPKPKSQDQKQRKPEEETGPLGQVIKEMRDVEERLGKPDTGEETRKKQEQIVKNLDGLIERMKNAPSQSMAMKMIREGNQPGQPRQPGQQGNQPGAMATGPPPTRPVDPKKGAVNTDLAKSIWGQLPAQFRDEMGNVLNERALPSKEDLIRLYYLSLGNKNSNKED